MTEAEFQQVVSEKRSKVVAIIMVKLGLSQEDAEDVVQTSLASMWRAVQAGRGPWAEVSETGADISELWMIGNSLRIGFNWLRDTKLREERLMAASLEPGESEGSVGTGLELEEVLAKLPKDVAEALVSVHMYGHTWAEVANEMDIDMPALQMRVGRALKALRKEFDDDNG